MPTPHAQHREVIARTLAQHDLSELTPRILRLAEPCLRLETRRASVAVGGSKVGGDPDLPAGAAWPAVDGRPMTFLAQLDLAEVAQQIASPLPPSGLLSFFFDRSDVHEGQDVCRVEWSRGAIERHASPAGLELLHECEVTFAPYTSVPSWRAGESAFDDEVADLTPAQRDELSDWRWSIDHELGGDAGPRHQLLGHPDGFLQDILLQRRGADAMPGSADLRAHARRYRSLLGLGFDEHVGLDWHDAGGAIWYLIESSALEAHAFSRVTCCLEWG